MLKNNTGRKEQDLWEEREICKGKLERWHKPEQDKETEMIWKLRMEEVNECGRTHH